MIVDFFLSLGLTGWLFLLVVFLLSYALFGGEKADPNMPPSPGIALPFVGHAYLLKNDPVGKFREWRKSVGDVFTLRMGSRNVVVINGYENLKHTLVKQASSVSDRPPSALRDVFPDSAHGVLTSSGANWKEQRTTSLSVLREFGMGKNILAEKIAEEIDVYTNELSKMTGQSVDLRNLTNMCVSNVICSIIFGRRYELDDPLFNKLMYNLNQQVVFLGQSNAVLFIPWLKYLPGDFFNYHKMVSMASHDRKFVKSQVERGLKESTTDNLASFSSAYVKEMEKKKAAGVETYLDESNLLRVVAHLFVAGTETTSNTIVWCLLYLLHNPKIQEKVHQEILDVVGRDRVPTMSDKPKLRYLTAVIMETQRMANILPLDLNHYVTAPLEVQGYVIPPGSTVIPCLDSVLMDDKIWGDADTFRPERFLDEAGNVVKREELVPFSLGRRVCLGEALAKMELFLYLATMFQRFKFLPTDPNNLPSIRAVFGATCAAESFTLKWEERKLVA